MYVVKNNGKFPVVIRDLNFHIEGGASVDLDLTFRREMTEKSVDLKNLVRCKKLIELNKSEMMATPKPSPYKVKEKAPAPESNNGESNVILMKLLKEFGDLKSILQSGVKVAGSSGEEENYTDETWKRLAEVKASSLTNKDMEVKKNFDDIGNVTEKSGADLGNMLDILDNLGSPENKGE